MTLTFNLPVKVVSGYLNKCFKDTPPTRRGEQLCQIILKYMHKCGGGWVARGILVIEWTAYDVVRLQHITLAWISLDGRSYGPEYDQSACRAMPLESPFTFSSYLCITLILTICP